MSTPRIFFCAEQNMKLAKKKNKQHSINTKQEYINRSSDFSKIRAVHELTMTAGLK